MASKGHRANILAPAHTHVGIGIAYNPRTGDVRIDQLFVDDYSDLEPLSLNVGAGDEVRIAGVLHEHTGRPLLNLAYEPFPEPMTVDELNQIGPLVPHADTYQAQRLPVHGGHFALRVRLGEEDQPGLYQVRLSVDTKHGQVLAAHVVVAVGSPWSLASAHPVPRARCVSRPLRSVLPACLRG